MRRHTRRKLRERRERAKRSAIHLFNSRLWARLLGRDHVLCIGDSHVKVMRRVALPGVWFWVEGIIGGTASGVLNPNSQTQSRTTFMAQLARAKSWQQVLIELGEVDCGFVIWQRAEREGLGVEQQLQRTLDSYATFLEEVVSMGFARVIVMSVPLPTINDLASEWFGPVANARRDVKATQIERTQLTLRFNEQLARRCEDLGVTFADVTSGQLDPATGLIDARFRHQSNLNHHLAGKPFAALISRQLADLWDVPQARTPRFERAQPEPPPP